MQTPAATIRESLGRSARFSGLKQKRADKVVDFQVDLEDIAKAEEREAAQIANEIAVDAADDRRRFLKYQAVEHAIRHGDRATQLAAFHSLVNHVEADEMREDARRLPRKLARELHAARLRALRAIFRDDFVPPYLEQPEPRS